MAGLIPVDWSASAQSELRAIHAFIARDSPIYARRMIDRIRRSVERRRRFPESGARVAEWDREDVREIIVGNYRIIYQLEPRRMNVLTVIHGARQLPDPTRRLQ